MFASLRFYISAASVIGLTACSSAIIQTPTLSTNPTSDYAEYYSEDDYKNSHRARFYLHPLPTDLARIAAEGRSAGIRNDQPEAFRDYVQNELLKRSDQICTIYITRLVHNFVQGNAGVKIAESLLKAVIVPVALAETAYQTVSGTVTSNLSNEILQHEAFKSNMRRIVERRAGTRTTILVNQEKPIKQYSFSRAIYDAENYHSECNYAVQYVSGESAPTPPATPAKTTEQPKAAIKSTAGGK